MTKSNGNGKGSDIRPMFIDRKKFDTEYDRIFKKNKEDKKKSTQSSSK